MDTSDPTLQTTASGTKRLFSNRASTLQPHERRIEDFQDHNGLLSPTITESKSQSDPLHSSHINQHPDHIGSPDSHLEKRPRNSDWPLKSNTVSNGALPEHRHALQTQFKASDLSTHQRSSSQSRPSKFVEGSMNDRASKKPHLSYTGDFEASVQQFDGKQITSSNDRKKQRLHGMAHHAKNSVALSGLGDESELTRPSGIFRFGRSLAAAFNPSSWKIWSRPQEEGTSRERIHGTRLEKFEDDRESNGVRNIRSSTSKSQTDILVKHASFGKHDSGIEFENHVLEDPGKLRPSKKVESSPEEKRHGRVFQEYPTVSKWGHNQGRAPEETSNLADLSFQNRKSSLPNIHMVYDHHKSSDHPDNLLRHSMGLRRLPSRKDLQKQQKLVKRVSDLEGKLEAARRQLAEALGEPIPAQASDFIRSRFMPGTLASLPSERLLGAHTMEDSDSGVVDESSGIGKVISADQRADIHVKEGQVEDLEAQKFATVSLKPHTKITARGVRLKIESSVESSDMQAQNLRLIENTKQTQAVLDLQKETPAASKQNRQAPRKRK